MAATVSPWAKPRSWALETEQHEEEIQQQQPNSGEPPADFPSLAVAAAKPKKKKGQTLSLAEFTSKPTQPSHQHQEKPQGLTTQELLALPTGPRERSAEELERDRGRLGGGFRSYGSNGSSRYSSGDESSNSRWGSSRVSDEPRRNGGFNKDKDSGPSRADEIDDWAAGKKSTVGSNGFDRRERERGGGGFFNSQSRADDSDNWGSSKASVPPTEGRRSNGGERKVGFTSNGGADAENWLRMKKEESTGTERPRLNLQPRTLPVSEGKQESPVTPSKPASRGSNPFGQARPREDVLAEKGQDPRKIDEQLEAMKIKEAAQKKADGFGKKGFGLGNSWSAPGEEDNRSWRKPEAMETRPQRFVELVL
jgi:hypothetical protein